MTRTMCVIIKSILVFSNWGLHNIIALIPEYWMRVEDFLNSIEFSIDISLFTDNAQLHQRHVSCVRRQAKVYVCIPRRVIPWLCEQGISRGKRPGWVVGMVWEVWLPEQHHAGVYERSRSEV